MPAERLRNDETVIGTMIRVVRNPAIALIAKQGGMDFIMLDMEHGSYSFDNLTDIFTASRAADLGCFVRVPELSRGYVSRVLDCGASGVMVPMVESAEQARKLVSWAKYTPVGKRGLGSAAGNTGYKRLDDAPVFMKDANRETLTIAQIETSAGVDAIDDIAAVDGIDALLIGPVDLSVSLGCPGDLTCSEMNSAIEKIVNAALNHDKIPGMHANNALLEKWLPKGIRLVMNTLDISMLISGMESVSDWFKPFKNKI